MEGKYKLKPLDAILFNGKDPVAGMIRAVENKWVKFDTLSPTAIWTHAGVVVDKTILPLDELEDEKLYLYESIFTGTIAGYTYSQIWPVDIPEAKSQGPFYVGPLIRPLDLVIDEAFSDVAVCPLRNDEWNRVISSTVFPELEDGSRAVEVPVMKSISLAVEKKWGEFVNGIMTQMSGNENPDRKLITGSPSRTKSSSAIFNDNKNTATTPPPLPDREFTEPDSAPNDETQPPPLPPRNPSSKPDCDLDETLVPTKELREQVLAFHREHKQYTYPFLPLTLLASASDDIHKFLKNSGKVFTTDKYRYTDGTYRKAVFCSELVARLYGAVGVDGFTRKNASLFTPVEIEIAPALAEQCHYIKFNGHNHLDKDGRTLTLASKFSLTGPFEPLKKVDVIKIYTEEAEKKIKLGLNFAENAVKEGVQKSFQEIETASKNVLDSVARSVGIKKETSQVENEAKQ